MSYGLKFIFGTEAYWVKDRHEKDRTNCHIVLLAKNENGRQWINEVLSTANEDGYYYRPRLDEELLFQLPPNDVFVTSACVAFWHYEPDYVENLVLRLHNHFKDNFMLEIQAHNTDKQKQLNARILELSKKYGIQMIVGLDSHYIYPEQSVERDALLAASDTHYDDEDGWYMDYPNEATVRQRFAEQGIVPPAAVDQAIRNTDLICDFEDYDSEVFQTNRKLPTLYPDKTPEEKYQIYNRLISSKFREYMKHVPLEDYQRYFDGVKMEAHTYRDTGMVDYPLIDYQIVKRGIEYGGIITNTGRGSAVSYFTNAQESTRYCNYNKDKFGNEITVIDHGYTGRKRISWKNYCGFAETGYRDMLNAGATPEEARDVLPLCLKTEIVCTWNLREWHEVLRLRTAKDAHPAIRALMIPVLKELQTVYPEIFNDIEASE